MTHSIEAERDKYQRMWREPRYRTHSPGHGLVKNFLRNAAWKPGETLIDLGCGTGRAGAALADSGLLVFLFDLIPGAVDPQIRLPFIEGCLWELPALSFDWVYCADVLEHIPPQHVDATLDGMARLTRKGGFLQIAHFQDGCGQLIGEILHLTVEGSAWWQEKVGKRWPIEKWESSGMHSIARLGRSWINGD